LNQAQVLKPADGHTSVMEAAGGGAALPQDVKKAASITNARQIFIFNFIFNMNSLRICE
jgi:hypothetical protein